MSGNPKDSKWYSTAQADRVRKHVKLTLSDAARAKLKKLGKAYGSCSEAVEQMIMEHE